MMPNAPFSLILQHSARLLLPGEQKLGVGCGGGLWLVDASPADMPGCRRDPLGLGQDMAPAPHCVLHLPRSAAM